MSIDRRGFLLSLAGAAAVRPDAAASAWRAGVATVDITPPAGIWMAGYAARKEAAQGAAQALHAKVLALEDPGGRRLVVVTLDVLGLTAPVVERLTSRLRRRYGLARASLLLCSSHTHSGPVVEDQLAVAYDLSASQLDDIRASTRRIEAQVEEVVGRALRALRPVRLQSGQGMAAIAANRRTSFDPAGPVDRAVPVLSAWSGDSLVAVLFGYACHNTTLPASFVRFHGDYAGIAQEELERRHAGATALFVAGCGADANPAPRGTIELARQHGVALADAVDATLAAGTGIRGRLHTAFDSVTLEFALAPGADAWSAKLSDDNPYVRRHARLMLDRIAREGRTQRSEVAPLHVARIGSLTMIAISGEVVVDYALALKRQYGDATWIAAYTDSVFGYLPSLRVLREGGYEGGEAALYYGRPGPFTETVETTVMSGIDALIAKTVGQ
jgi:neutral ceramidase